MTMIMSVEKRELIKKLQEAIGRSQIRLKILKEINKRESVNDLIERLKIPQPTVSKAITRFHQGYGLIKPVKKKDNSQVFDKIPLLKQIGSLDQWVRIDIEETEEEIKSKKLKPNIKIHSDVPFLDFRIEQDAKKMAEGPYHLLYLLENSIRKFIGLVMTSKYGAGWWHQVVTNSDILRRVAGRIKLEGINKWHVPRGEHELFYTDLEDLVYFLNKEKSEFAKHLGDVDYWITKIRTEIKLSRNIVDHHNPLPQREINRLSQTLEDWKRQLKDAKI